MKAKPNPTERDAFADVQEGGMTKFRHPDKLGDLSDLPEDLLAELSNPVGDETTRRVMAVMDDMGGTADIDQLLIGLYRRYGEIYKRRYLQNKVWRICRSGLLYSIKGRKGLYTTEVQPIPVNLPFERPPNCSHDPGIGDWFICPKCNDPNYDPSQESNIPAEPEDTAS